MNYYEPIFKVTVLSGSDVITTSGEGTTETQPGTGIVPGPYDMPLISL
jgi:hypothetical protein